MNDGKITPAKLRACVPSDVVEHLRDGYIILAGNGVASLVDRNLRKLPDSRKPIAIPYDVFRLMLHEWHSVGQWCAIGEIQKNRTGYKSGWREMGLQPPPRGQAYFLMVQ